VTSSASLGEALDGLVLCFAVGLNDTRGHVWVFSIPVDVKAEILSLDGRKGS
jgi:hypothetical protein